MDWAGWALFGLVATAALTVVMVAAQLAGLTRLDLPLLLGTIVTADPDRARVAGFFMHLAIGLGFALGYAASFALLDEATWLCNSLSLVGGDPCSGRGSRRQVGRIPPRWSGGEDPAQIGDLRWRMSATTT